MSKQRVHSLYLDFLRQLSLDSFGIDAKIATEATYRVDPVLSVLYLLFGNHPISRPPSQIAVDDILQHFLAAAALFWLAVLMDVCC